MPPMPPMPPPSEQNVTMSSLSSSASPSSAYSALESMPPAHTTNDKDDARESSQTPLSHSQLSSSSPPPQPPQPLQPSQPLQTPQPLAAPSELPSTTPPTPTPTISPTSTTPMKPPRSSWSSWLASIREQMDKWTISSVNYVYFIGWIMLPILVSFVVVQFVQQSQQSQYEQMEQLKQNEQIEHIEHTPTTQSFQSFQSFIANLSHYLLLSIKTTLKGTATFLVTLWHFLCRVLGTALGIGLGLGLAGHVFEVLGDQVDRVDNWGKGDERYERDQRDIVVVGNDGVETTLARRSGGIYDNRSHPHRSHSQSFGKGRASSITLPISNNSNSSSNTNEQSVTIGASQPLQRTMEDANSYHPLMRAAGYVVDGTLRGQMVRGEQAALCLRANASQYPPNAQRTEQSTVQKVEKLSTYKFEKGNTATTHMKKMWPNLSPLIHESLGKLTEFVIRDYVASWYAKVDENVVYVDPAEGAVEGGAVSEGSGAAVGGGAGAGDGSTAPSNVAGMNKSNSTSNLSLSGTNHNNFSMERPQSTASGENGYLLSNSRHDPFSNHSASQPLQQRRAPSNLVQSAPVSSIAANATNSAGGSTPSQFSSSLQPIQHHHQQQQQQQQQFNVPISPTSLISTSSNPYPLQQQHQQFQQRQQTQHNQQHQTQPHQQHLPQPHQQRTMVLTTTGLRPTPFLTSLYTTFSYLLGMLSTRVSENVNVLELLLVNFPHVLAMNLRVYRELRGVALEKQRRRMRNIRAARAAREAREAREGGVREGHTAERDRHKHHKHPKHKDKKEKKKRPPRMSRGASMGMEESNAGYSRLDSRESDIHTINTNPTIPTVASSHAGSAVSSSMGLNLDDSLRSEQEMQFDGDPSHGGSHTTHTHHTHHANHSNPSKAESEDEISEIAIVREYLLSGRLHRAVTFGLDVPSLLFADPLGKDCPPVGVGGAGGGVGGIGGIAGGGGSEDGDPEFHECNDHHNFHDASNASYDHTNHTDNTHNTDHHEEDYILHQRLFTPPTSTPTATTSSLLSECELDYHRVLASKLTQLILPQSEVDSSVVRSMMVEMLASCVLGPIMGCFDPNSVNGWILSGLGSLEEDASGGGNGGSGGNSGNGGNGGNGSSGGNASTTGTGKGKPPSETTSTASTSFDAGTHTEAGISSSVSNSIHAMTESVHTFFRADSNPESKSVEDDLLDADMTDILNCDAADAVDGVDAVDAVDGVDGVDAVDAEASVSSETEDLLFDMDATSTTTNTTNVTSLTTATGVTSVTGATGITYSTPAVPATVPNTSRLPRNDTDTKKSGLSTANKSEQIITLLSISIIELRNYVDFEDVLLGVVEVDWDKPQCREAVRHLVLVIEVALLLGGRSERKYANKYSNKHSSLMEDSSNMEENEISEMEIEATLESSALTRGMEDSGEGSADEFEVDIDMISETKVTATVMHQPKSLSAALMELTGDIDAFEKLVLEAEQESGNHNANASNSTNAASEEDSLGDPHEMENYTPKQNELSTLRTLIAAWLHTGQVYKVLSIIVRAKHTILRPFYYKNSFLRGDTAQDFIRLLRQLDGVDVLVDTMAVLASPCLLAEDGFDALIESFERESRARGMNVGGMGGMGAMGGMNVPPSPNQGAKKEDSSMIRSGLFDPNQFGWQPNTSNNPLSMVGSSVRANLVQNRDRLQRFAQSATESFHWGPKGSDFGDNPNIPSNPTNPNVVSKSQHRQPNSQHSQAANTLQHTNHSIPAYLDFSKNAIFASSLRTERERRNESWLREVKHSEQGKHGEKGEKIMEKVDFICRTKGVKEKDVLMHKELHHLSRFFYSNTNEIRVEPCSIPEGSGSAAGSGSSGTSSSGSGAAANVTVKAVASRRKIEIPDEDSSFLLRAQPRPIKPLAIHRDQQAANLACKVYVAMYEEPAIHPRTKRYYGGKYLRQCLLSYYPSDRTATVSVAKDTIVLDRRNQQPSRFNLPQEFQKQKHICLKVATGGILTSPLMEPSDFNSSPRVGKALDFVHRMSLFERPMIELGGKKFIVQESTSLGTHRADASSLELSDASMTAAIILRGSTGLNCDLSSSDTSAFVIKVSADGTPLVLLRTSSPTSETTDNKKSKDEARPYRPSFIRAALYIKSARQEAQHACLISCIRNGSARTSSKLKSDEWLQPTLKLLQFSNSRRQEEQSILLRDLRFGINHIDRGQLCRNGLLNPRFPTVLRGLTTKVDGAIEVKAASNVDILGSPYVILFKIKCVAITEFVGEEENDESGDTSNTSNVASGDKKQAKRAKSRYFREEWTVYRSLRDFSMFHKHIKTQVSPTEHSASASARLVGAATAALTIVGGNNGSNLHRKRGPLVPSLSPATKAGTMPGLSNKKIAEKKKKYLDEYLKYLVAPNNLLSRCPELLKFLGAYTTVYGLDDGENAGDIFGRKDIKCDELDTEKLKLGIVQVKQGKDTVSSKKITAKVEVKDPISPKLDTLDEATVSTTSTTAASTSVQEDQSIFEKKLTTATRRVAMIRAGEVRFKDVRRSIFSLLRHLFDLDNASFFRSRVISALKTMSMAVTSAQDFHRMLFEYHVQYMNGEWVSGWIYYVVDMFWPNGVFYTKGPDLTEAEKIDLKKNSKAILEKAFPDQLKTVLGKHTKEGLDILHEMLQNRLVLKSMAYMLMDMVWGAIFPELGDFVTCAECLEKEG